MRRGVSLIQFRTETPSLIGTATRVRAQLVPGENSYDAF
jgi:hypothetical protein